MAFEATRDSSQRPSASLAENVVASALAVAAGDLHWAAALVAAAVGPIGVVDVGAMVAVGVLSF